MRNSQGFTLLEIVIAVAIVALLAGATAPLVFKELQQAREEATLKELAAIKTGLEDFFVDTGRFPSEAEGLTALVADPGADGWAGPYVGGGSSNPATEVLSDAFGNSYLYDLAPATNPAGAADLLVASGGSDQNITFGAVGGTWTIAGNGDDLLLLVSAGSLNRDKDLTTRGRMDEIAQAARAFFADNAAWPATFSDLTVDYMDAGLGGESLIDAWNSSLTLASDGGTPPVLSIISLGPNRTDNSGGGDDLVLQVSSIPPARQTTLSRLEIAQTALNSSPTILLTGVWASDLGALGLSPALANDGWGHPLQINAASRVVFSSGPDNNAASINDNLPRGVGP
jgi:general secretion pathway protein G